MKVKINTPKMNIGVGVQRIINVEKDHSKLINRDLENQHPISAITGLQEALNNSGKIEDVKVNNTSVVSNKIANIELKTINNQNISGTGNINIDVENVVKTSANQNLTIQQKLNARTNIDAVGTDNIKQSTGQSTTDVISQKGITDELANKQNNKPDGTHLLVSTDTGKIDLVYIPSTVLGGITNGGTFNGSGVITASSYAQELDGEIIDQVAFASYPSYYFICSSPYSFAGFDFAVGDWAISLGNGWAKLNATDAVTSVNGKMGQVVLNYNDVGAVKSTWGIDNANKNLVTDDQGNVTTSDYALGQIIVDYYEELPTNVPETAKASVTKPSSYPIPLNYSDLYTYIQNQTVFDSLILKNNISTASVYYGAYVELISENYASDGLKYIIGYTDSYSSETSYYLEVQHEAEDFSNIYLYSFSNQLFPETEQEIKVGWNKIEINYNPYSLTISQIDYSEVEKITNAYISDYDCNQEFLNNFGEEMVHLAGEYIYTEVQPSTNPKTYYWRYTPTNVQADWNETNPLSLAYIKNKPNIATPKKKILTNSSSNYSVSNNVVTVTDNDVKTTNHVELYPSDTTTETWLENNLSSCIITQTNGTFSFAINANLPSTFSMYYIITEVE